MTYDDDVLNDLNDPITLNMCFTLNIMFTLNMNSLLIACSYTRTLVTYQILFKNLFNLTAKFIFTVVQNTLITTTLKECIPNIGGASIRHGVARATPNFFGG